MSNLSYMPLRDRDEDFEEMDAPSFDGMPADHGEQAFDLRQIMHTLWRRKMIIIATAFILTLLAVLGVMQATPLYVAEAQLVVERQGDRALEFSQVRQEGRFDHYTNRTEAAVLMSRGLAGKVVDELDLVNHPLFNPALAKPKSKSFLERMDLRGFLRGLIPDWIRDELRSADQKDKGAADNYTKAEMAAYFREDVVEAFLAGVDVYSSDMSRVLEVSYVSRDPTFAAQAANALAEVYINETVLRKFAANARATDWLNQQVAELQLRLEASRNALESHRRSMGFVDVQGQSSVLGQQLGQLNIDLVRARSGRAEAEARYQQIQKLLKSEGGSESAATVLDSPLIQRLREQEAAVIRQLGELKTQLRGRHPTLMLKESELADLQKKISREVEKITTSLGNELEIAEIRETTTASEIERLKQAIQKQNESIVTLRALESEVAANDAIYQTILTRFKETGVQDDATQQADARLISPAVPPLRPSYPRKTLIVFVVLMASVVAGIVLVFVLEHLDVGFRSLPQIERVTGVPPLGIMPKLQGFGLRHLRPQDAILEKPNSMFAESIRSIRTAMMLSGPAAPRTFLVTSSEPEEGKTSLVLSLGRSAAQAGQRVIVVDCDMRRPSIHEELDVPNLRGLAEYLEDTAELEDIIEIDDPSGMHFVTAGHSAPNPTDLINADRMWQLIKRLERGYDVALFKTPPSLAFSEATILSKHVDKCIYVVRWGETDRAAATLGIRNLLESKADVAGIVLSQVDARKHSGYSYGSHRDTYGIYEKYYQK
ncbi:MAG: polysaccharide biosynthesis tyrosine autokinase [Alphaproteobacteria bacterium]|nr:polysaccharide biosynthesis tyrosine autokinase [Alphaproteobacteria bacterium]